MAEPPRSWIADPAGLTEELVQAQKMDALGRIAPGLAHDLNNPLAAIVAFSQLIQSDSRLPEDLRHDAELLVQEADRTRRILQALLDFARPRPPERHPTPLPALVRSVLDLVDYLLTSNRVTVEVEIAPDLPVVPIDRSRMQQVLLSLTLNAIDAIRRRGRGGRLRFRARRAGDPDDPHLRLDVTDDGPGIARQHRDRLFLPISSTRRPGNGRGLGLAVSSGIVAAHGGRLRFEPADGGGATFVIELPLNASSGEALQPRG